ncbi:MAG: hypothetical protein K2M67_02365, partial [Muribaculaceae bacterium]|nr:hypothetical protein [Muribaculaceae bacterium]
LAGNEKFGFDQPVFLSNVVNCLVADKKFNDALAVVDQQIAASPDVAALYALHGFVNARSDNFKDAEADYRKAASFDNADFETLKNASRMIFRRGSEMWNEIEGNTPEAAEARKNVRENYWNWAKATAERAANINPNDGDLNDILDSIDYVLTTYTF